MQRLADRGEGKRFVPILGADHAQRLVAQQLAAFPTLLGDRVVDLQAEVGHFRAQLVKGAVGEREAGERGSAPKFVHRGRVHDRARGPAKRTKELDHHQVGFQRGAAGGKQAVEQIVQIRGELRAAAAFDNAFQPGRRVRKIRADGAARLQVIDKTGAAVPQPSGIGKHADRLAVSRMAI